MAEELLLNFYMDIAFILVFASTLIVLYTNASFWKILFTFYLPFIFLITLMLIDGKGLAYSVESNAFGAFIIIIFTSRNRMTIYLSGALLCSLIVGLLIVEYQYQMYTYFELQDSNQINFIFSSLGAIAFTFYAKHVFNKSKKKMAGAIDSLNHSNELLQVKNNELLRKKEMLDGLAESLDMKVRNRSRQLKTQKQQVEEYLSITMTELFDAYQQTIDSIEQFDSKKHRDSLTPMLIQSGDKLRQEMEGLRMKIEESVHEVD